MNGSINFGVMAINFAGGPALFPYGMHKMTEAPKIVAGGRAQNLPAKLTANRFSAAFAGALVTAVIRPFSITTVPAGSYRRRNQNLKPPKRLEAICREIYKALYLVARATFEAFAENDREKAREVFDSKKHVNGLIARARGHPSVQPRRQAPEHLGNYRIETSTLENFKRIRNLLRATTRLILRQEAEPAQTDRPNTAEMADENVS